MTRAGFFLLGLRAREVVLDCRLSASIDSAGRDCYCDVAEGSRDLVHFLTATDIDRFSSDEAGIVGREEGAHGRSVGSLTDAV